MPTNSYFFSNSSTMKYSSHAQYFLFYDLLKIPNSFFFTLVLQINHLNLDLHSNTQKTFLQVLWILLHLPFHFLWAAQTNFQIYFPYSMLMISFFHSSHHSCLRIDHLYLTLQRTFWRCRWGQSLLWKMMLKTRIVIYSHLHFQTCHSFFFFLHLRGMQMLKRVS